MKPRVTQVLRDVLDRDVVLEKPKDRSFGHFSTPIAFSLAKELRKSPMVIAQELAASFAEHETLFESVESLKGYINFRLSERFLDEYASWALSHPSEYGRMQRSAKILIEFVSANPTGPLHIGHTRGAVYGDTLVRLGRHLGYDITAEYYVNDAGNQIDLLGISLQLEGQSYMGDTIEWPEKYYRGEYMSLLAKEALSLFGEEALRDVTRQRELALWAKDKILAQIIESLRAIGVEFDTFVSEAALYGEWDRVMTKMGDGVYVRDEKTLIRSSDLGDDHDRVVVREDTRPTYLAGDIIYHNQKYERAYDHYINIWGADHHGYITRVKAAVQFLGYDARTLEVQLAQMVSLLKEGEPFKMSKRAGTVILMSDVVEEIGAEALRFMFASKKSDTALEFDVEELKRHDSNNPIYYIQYAHARIQTLLGKSTLTREAILATPLSGLSEDADALLFEALLLPEVIEDAFESRQVQKLPDYLKVLAGRLHKFYYDTRILGTPEEAKLLKLFLMVALSIKSGLALLGIEAKDQM